MVSAVLGHAMKFLIAIAIFFAVVGVRYLFFPHRAKDGGFRVFQAPSTLVAYRVVGATMLAFGFLFAAGVTLGIPSTESARASTDRIPLQEPLFLPLPAVASLAPADPKTSRELCDGAMQTRMRLAPAKIRPAVLGYIVERDGSVNDIRVASSSGNSGLDMAIALCVSTLRFQPPANGQALSVQAKASSSRD